MGIFYDYILNKLRLRDAPSGANTYTIVKTVGMPGVAGCDHNFTSAANATEQSIQLGLAAIIPASSVINVLEVKCLTSATTAGFTVDMGDSSGADNWMSGVDLDTANKINSVSTQVGAKAAASSLYFSGTPGANWNTQAAGKWKIYITVTDNSNN